MTMAAAGFIARQPAAGMPAPRRSPGRAGVLTLAIAMSAIGRGEGALCPGGRVTTDFGGLDMARAVVVQPDGKPVVAGLTEDFATFVGRIGLARYLPDGRLDPAFGSGGLVTTGGGFSSATALVLEPDGRLVTTARFGSGPTTDFALTRYLPEGRTDPTFGTKGKVITSFGAFAVPNALARQPDGKLVAAGHVEGDPNTFRLALARYLPDGRLDPTFGTNGKVTTDFGGDGFAFAVAVQADGRLVAAGSSGTTDDADFVLVRYLATGELDTSFGSGGRVVTDFGAGVEEDIAWAVVVQPDGRLVAAGHAGDATALDFAVVRYLPDGRPDPEFGTAGTVTTDLGQVESAKALVLQPDGKLVVAGDTGGPLGDDFALARYLPDGSLDPAFGTGGRVTTDFGDLDFAFALALAPDGRLVAAGLAEPGSDFALARYLPDGSLDPTFGPCEDDTGVPAAPEPGSSTTTTLALSTTSTTSPAPTAAGEPCPDAGFDGVGCVLRSTDAAGACANERIGDAVRRRIVRAGSLVRRGARASSPRQARRLARRLARTLEKGARLASAAGAAGRQSVPCAVALAGALGEGRVRAERLTAAMR
jgi:uncharacterized delta-60 repeat protein